MLKTRIAILALGVAALALPAHAQTSPSPAQPPAAAHPSAGAGSVQFMTKQMPNEWRASKFMGLDVYGANNEKIGDISEILLDSSGNAKAAVISVGGFLGIGAKDVAVPFNAIQWRTEPMRTAAGGTGTGGTGTTGAATTAGTREFPDHAVLNLTKEQLQNAPAYTYLSESGSTGGGTTGGTTKPGGANR